MLRILRVIHVAEQAPRSAIRIGAVMLLAVWLFSSLGTQALAFTLIERNLMLEGRVTDGTTGRGIDNAIIVVAGQMADGSVRQTVNTNNGGHYLIGLLLPAVQYQAFVSADGYQSLGVVGDVANGGGVPITLNGDGRVSHHAFVLLPAVQNTP